MSPKIYQHTKNQGPRSNGCRMRGCDTQDRLTNGFLGNIYGFWVAKMPANGSYKSARGVLQLYQSANTSSLPGSPSGAIFFANPEWPCPQEVWTRSPGWGGAIWLKQPRGKTSGGAIGYVWHHKNLQLYCQKIFLVRAGVGPMKGLLSTLHTNPFISCDNDIQAKIILVNTDIQNNWPNIWHSTSTQKIETLIFTLTLDIRWKGVQLLGT